MARVTAFGVTNVAPSGAVVGGLVIVVGTRGPRLRWSSLPPWWRQCAARSASRSSPGGCRQPARCTPAVAGVAHLGIGTSSWVDPALVAERMAVIAALAVSVLVKVGPAAGL
jgi:hypothetical protein